MRAARRRRARLLELAQVAGVDLAALAHPLRRRALVGDAHLVGGVGEQPPDDRGADRAGAAGDQHAAHARVRRGPRARRRRRTPGPRPSSSTGRRPGSRRRAARRSPRASRGSRNSEWLVATTTDLGARRSPARSDGRRRRHVRVVHGDVGQLALEQPDQLVRERVALVVGVGLERQPEHRDLAVRRASPGGAWPPRAGTAAPTR